jgi:oligo-1,6-glucosidase
MLCPSRLMPVFEHYRRLIELRHTESAVAHGDFTMLLPDHSSVYAFTRQHDDVELLVLGNFSSAPAEVDLPGAAAWSEAELVLGNLPHAELDPTVLRPWEARVLRRRTAQ